MDANLDPVPEPDFAVVSAIMANLSDEIRRPLDLMKSEIETLKSELPDLLSESEHAQALMMLTLCEQIDQLTRIDLGPPGDGEV
jgi:signal transduction histidine kinase